MPRARHCERSEAIQLRTTSWIRTSWIASSPRSQRKRFAFVAGNDGARYTGMTANARPSRHRDSALHPGSGRRRELLRGFGRLHGEAFVAFGGDVVADLAVGAD